METFFLFVVLCYTGKKRFFQGGIFTVKCRADFPVKGAIFDMDGTLLDSMHHWRVWDFAALEPWGLTLTEAQEEEARALMTDKKLIDRAQYLVDRYGLNATAQDIFDRWLLRIGAAYEGEIECKPMVPQYLQALHQSGAKVGIATMTGRDFSRAALERLGLWDQLDFFLTAQETGISKRDPDIFLRAAECIGLPPSQCTVFEDSLYAIETAKKAGFQVCAIFDETAREDWPQICALADRHIECFTELLED
nr:HAD family phosphatase [Acetanaerobacterium sp. MSJ-12]